MVDLIPAEYRRALRVRRSLRDLGWSCLSLVLVLGLCATGVAHRLKEERAALAHAKQLHAQAQAQQARLAEIKARRDLADSQVQALAALRGGAAAARLFDALDAALSGRIWFQELAYSRAAEAPGPKVEAGGSGAAPAKRAEAKSNGGTRHARQRAEIRGVAIDHAALAEFIRELGARPGVVEVRLLDTSARNYPNLQVVDFQVAALLAAAADTIPAGAIAPAAVPITALKVER